MNDGDSAYVIPTIEIMLTVRRCLRLREGESLTQRCRDIEQFFEELSATDSSFVDSPLVKLYRERRTRP